MRINNNLMAMNTHRQMGVVNNSQAKSMEKLSSGYRINRAGDDAAGLSISEKMRSQVRGLNQASRNAQDGISMIQTAEGALQETEAILQRMRELSVQASNDTLDTNDRTAIGQEMKDLASEINRISKTTEFNGKKLLNGSLSTTQTSSSTAAVGTNLNTGATATISAVDVSGALAGETYTLTSSGNNVVLTRGSDSVAQTVAAEATIGADGTSVLEFSELGITITMTGDSAKTNANIADDLNGLTIVTKTGNSSAQLAIGANGTADEKMSIAFDKFDDSTLGTTTLKTLVSDKAAAAVVSTSALADALTVDLDVAIKEVSEQRSKLGASQNRLEHTISNLDMGSENLQAAESRIRDVDMAKEMMNFTKNNILAQAAQSMLAQANQAPQGVLQLLR